MTYRTLLAGVTACAMALAVPVSAVAQGTEISLSGQKQDTSQPVEVTADSLQVNQADGTATFLGNVLVVQDTLRMSAQSVVVIYASEAGRIAELRASGGVTFVNGPDAAEAREAVYDIAAGTLVMTGDVILMQGATALSADRMTVDLERGTGEMEGRVRTVFQAGQN